MSRLSDILGVKEGQEFRFGDDIIYRVTDGVREWFEPRCKTWFKISDDISLLRMIEHPELIQPLPEKLTEQQITAIKGRIAECTPWAARDSGGHTCFYMKKPKLSNSKSYFYSDNGYVFSSHSDLYDFITFENSPVYLPELIEGSEK